VRLDRFGDFMPGQTPAATAIVLGAPDTIRLGKGGARYFVYRRPQGVFEVAEEPHTDGVSHPLYFRPSDQRPEELIAAVVVSRLRPNASEETVQLFECGVEGPEFVVILEHARVREVVWFPLEELSDRRDPRQCVP
jgi:hypothetical protein